MTPISADGFLEIQTPETVRLELDEGALIVSPRPPFEHQVASAAMLGILTAWTHRERFGVAVHRMDVRLADATVRAPDLILIAPHQREILRRRVIVGGPHLVVEVLSESTAALDRGKKMLQYAAAGVRHYWLVDPLARTLERFENTDGEFALVARAANDETVMPAEFPDVAIPLAQLWVDELPAE